MGKYLWSLVGGVKFISSKKEIRIPQQQQAPLPLPVHRVSNANKRDY